MELSRPVRTKGREKDHCAGPMGIKGREKGEGERDEPHPQSLNFATSFPITNIPDLNQQIPISHIRPPMFTISEE